MLRNPRLLLVTLLLIRERKARERARNYAKHDRTSRMFGDSGVFLSRELANVSILALRLEFQRRCNAFTRPFLKLAISRRSFFRLINSTRSLQARKGRGDLPPWKISLAIFAASAGLDECGLLLRSLFTRIRPSSVRFVFYHLEDSSSYVLNHRLTQNFELCSKGLQPFVVFRHDESFGIGLTTRSNF